jgi:hypothetical protein
MEKPRATAVFKAPLGLIVKSSDQEKDAAKEPPKEFPSTIPVENKSATAKDAVFGLSHLEVIVCDIELVWNLLGDSR